MKPNLLAAEPPERAVTTHPQVFRALALALKRYGIVLSYGDSPGLGSMERAAKVSGIAGVAGELAIEAADFKNGSEIHCDAAIQNKKFTIAEGIKHCDGLISIAKLKTHGLMRFTGAVKNQFGCVPGLLKGEYHLKLPDQVDFARMLVDLNLALNPRLYLLDGIVAMEGNGPRGGRPRHLGMLVLSTDPVALDACVCRWLGISTDSVPTLTVSQEAGLGKYKEEDIEIVGEIPEWAGKISFSTPGPGRDYSGQAKYIRHHIVARPVINSDLCKYCGICLHCCPQKPSALTWPDKEKGGIPQFDYYRCLRCYCCQEMCPEGAIRVYTPGLGRVLNFLLPPNRRN